MYSKNFSPIESLSIIFNGLAPILAQNSLSPRSLTIRIRKTPRERRRLEDAKVLQRKNEKFRRDTNPNYKLGGALRNRIRGELNKLKKLNIDVNKCAKSIDLLGCSLSDYKTYIESLWEEGMNWENHGFGDTCWHIDHIKPCSFFDLTDPLQQRECFHFSNTQPLWQRDNLAKGDKLNHFK